MATVETLEKRQHNLIGQMAVQRALMGNADTYDQMIKAYEATIKILKKLKKLEESK